MTTPSEPRAQSSGMFGDNAEQTRRASEALDMMNEALNSLNPAERDERLQQILARLMTPTQRFEATGSLFNFALEMAHRVDRTDCRD